MLTRGLLYRPDDGNGDGGDSGAAAWTPPEGLEQFKTPEDLAKSYMESRSEMDRLRDQMAQERERFNEALAAMETAQQAPAPQQQYGDFDPAVAAWSQALEQGDLQAAFRIQQQAMMAPMTEAVGKVLDDRFKQFEPHLEAQTKAQREASLRMAEDLVVKEIGADRYQEALPQITEFAERYLPASASVEGYRDSILDMVKIAEHQTLQQRIADYEQERAEKLAASTLTSSGRVANVATGDAAKQEFERIKGTRTGSYSELMGGG